MNKALILLLALGTSAAAQDADLSIGGEISTPVETANSPTAEEPKPMPTAKGKRLRERVQQKDAEGTEALGRFEADTVIKSKYHLDGQPLEVDPD